MFTHNISHTHPLMTRGSTPIGFHCEHFENALLLQIISVEIEVAIRKIWREKGIMIGSQTQDAWSRIILQQIESDILKEHSAHSLLPSVIQQRMTEAVDALLQEEIIHGDGCTTPATTALPHEPQSYSKRANVFTRLLPWRLLPAIWHLVFDKQLE